MIPDRTQVGARLSEAGARLVRAEVERGQAVEDIARWARLARERDLLTVTEIARIAGVSRVTVYSLLRRAAS